MDCNCNCECWGRLNSLEARLDGLEQGRPALPSGLNALFIFSLMLAAASIAALAILIGKRDINIVFDFFSYALPLAAAVVGGLGIYYPTRTLRCFWASGIFLYAGLLAYVLSKGLSRDFISLGWLVLTCFLIGGVMYDERKNKKPHPNLIDKIGGILIPLSFIFLLLVSIFAVYNTLRGG